LYTNDCQDSLAIPISISELTNMKIKRVGPIVLTLVACLLLGHGTAQANFIVGPVTGGAWTTINNGGFESGSSGWTTIGTAGNFSITSTPTLYGTQSGALNTTTSFSGPGYAIQSINITGLAVGQQYVLSGFLDASQLTSGDLYIDLSDLPNNVADPTVWAPIGQSGFGWQDFTAFAPTVNVRVVRDSNFINSGIGGSKSTNPGGPVVVGQSGYFDEIAITLKDRFKAPTAVPEPSSLACVGGLVAGLSVLSRRRRQA
jgi:hypothetical protein